VHDVHVVSIGVLVCCEREAGHILTFATDAAAAGISKASTALNVVLMIIGAWGVLACTRADYLWVSAHSAMVLGLIFVFLVYIFLAIAFGKYAGSMCTRAVCVWVPASTGGASGGSPCACCLSGDEDNLIVILVFAFCVVDVVVGCMTANFTWAILCGALLRVAAQPDCLSHANRCVVHCCVLSCR